MTKEQLEAVAKFRTDEAQAQINATEKASYGVKTEYRAKRQARGTVDLNTATGAVDDIVAVALLRAPAVILWHDVKIVTDSDASSIQGDIGVLNEGGTFTKKATLASGDTSLTDLAPEPDQPALTQDTWVALQLKGTVPTTGKASFYVDYATIS